MPMTIKDLIDQYVETKAHKEQLTADIRTANEKLATLEKDLMEMMSQAGITQAASDKASLSMKQARHPAIDDWQAFYEYVARTGQFELLHKRLSSTAFRERWEAGEVIPGTSVSEVWELSVRRK